MRKAMILGTALAGALVAAPARAQEAPAWAAPVAIDSSAGLAALSDELASALDRDFDSFYARGILSTDLGGGRLFQPAPKQLVVSPYRLRLPPAPRTEAFNWAAPARLDRGDASTLALGLAQKLVDGGQWRSDLQLHHAQGPIDVRVAMKGTQPLVAGGPMRLTYDSSAMLDVTRSLRLGVEAKGDLGSTSDLALAPDQTATALARLKLLGQGATLSAETAYTMPLGATPESAVNRFRASLQFNWKL